MSTENELLMCQTLLIVISLMWVVTWLVAWNRINKVDELVRNCWCKGYVAQFFPECKLRSSARCYNIHSEHYRGPCSKRCTIDVPEDKDAVD